MLFSKCPDCGKWKLLTKHSKTGSHKPPYVYLCRDCHDKREGTKQKRKNLRFQKGSGGKYAKGTRRKKRK